MISLDKAVVARLVSHGHHFEILVDPQKAWLVREGEEAPITDVVASFDVYKDASRAEKAGEETLVEAFGTTQFEEIARKILKKGEIQLTTDQRKKMLEERRLQIVHLIAREAVDPKTNLPHPPARIERAMEEAKVSIDPFKSASRQVEEIVNKLRPLIPIRFAKARVAIKIGSQYSGKCYGYIHDLKKLKEEWLNDGSLAVLVEIPAGLQTEVYEKLNAMTHGSVETKLVEII
jgi:ribosome maturation protein SDO1